MFGTQIDAQRFGVWSAEAERTRRQAQQERRNAGEAACGVSDPCLPWGDPYLVSLFAARGPLPATAVR